MKVEQIYTGCLAQGAYYIESNGEVAIIDPLREVQDYIDTPVKRYSTGMSLKLAVAISLFLDGDILIYDEILAVADEKFRKLATQEINKKVDNEKKTLLLVSHQKQNLLDVCNKAILLDNGKILNIDSQEKILHEYEKLINN